MINLVIYTLISLADLEHADGNFYQATDLLTKLEYFLLKNALGGQ